MTSLSLKIACIMLLTRKKERMNTSCLELLGKCARFRRGEREEAKVTEEAFPQEN